MGLSPLKPQDESQEEQERYNRDLEDRRKNPRDWGIEEPPKYKFGRYNAESAGPAITAIQAHLAALDSRVSKLEGRRPPGRPRKMPDPEESEPGDES